MLIKGNDPDSIRFEHGFVRNSREVVGVQPEGKFRDEPEGRFIKPPDGERVPPGHGFH